MRAILENVILLVCYLPRIVIYSSSELLSCLPCEADERQNKGAYKISIA